MTGTTEKQTHGIITDETTTHTGQRNTATTHTMIGAATPIANTAGIIATITGTIGAITLPGRLEVPEAHKPTRLGQSRDAAASLSFGFAPASGGGFASLGTSF